VKNLKQFQSDNEGPRFFVSCLHSGPVFSGYFPRPEKKTRKTIRLPTRYDSILKPLPTVFGTNSVAASDRTIPLSDAALNILFSDSAGRPRIRVSGLIDETAFTAIRGGGGFFTARRRGVESQKVQLTTERKLLADR